MTRGIAFLVFPDFQILDLTGPLSAFDMASRRAAPPAYRPAVLSETGGPVASSCGLRVETEPLGEAVFDTLVAVGGGGVYAARSSPALLGFLSRAAPAARRVTSVCSGAFLLAAAGILDGRRVTTHWQRALRLQRDHPGLKVEADRIFIQDGPVWTSAGITAGIDLALALIEDDLGLEVARAVARELVVYHRRPGGQSQFSALIDLDPSSDRIRAALAFAREHLHEALPVERLAGAACLSPRQFGRAFLAETGETPARAVERLRAEAARLRVEAGFEPLEEVARHSGFRDPERMRRAFLRAFGQPPQALRRAARAQAPRRPAAQIST
ncbi:GlxA family transcriptional regulator [Labrys wisconsinensis]|uniref:Transcriptional regulator GlxA family with amidase domain n=1 Tax=Labrys wisconsinensis TaxID=425677 RepID=A0ABU0JLJ0_9HYPH|nr:GlxA family transcriptional regulator [Labrys wisconsinensis]MDQ0475160.1 transcriptional regulator GlxA family with amidase domain [Labrys wisconsinensis]